MGSVVVVLEPPVVDEQLCFEEGVEAFDLEQLAAEVAVAGFNEGILPGCSRLDVAGLRVVEAAAVAQRLRAELGAVACSGSSAGARPRRSTICSSVETASSALILCATGVASASRVCSSVTVRILIGRPSALRSLTKTGRPDLIRLDGDQVAGHSWPTPLALRSGGQPESFVAPEPLAPACGYRPSPHGAGSPGSAGSRIVADDERAAAAAP